MRRALAGKKFKNAIENNKFILTLHSSDDMIS